MELLPDDVILSIADQLDLPQVNNFAKTCSRFNSLLMTFYEYRVKEKIIFSMETEVADKVTAAACANIHDMLCYYFERWKKSSIDFWEYASLGAAAGGHLPIIEHALTHNITNVKPVFLIAVQYKSECVIDKLLLTESFRAIEMDDDFTRTISQAGNITLFKYMIDNRFIIYERDFMIITCDGIKPDNYIMLELLLESALKQHFNFFSSLKTMLDIEDDDDLEDYYSALSVCFDGPVSIRNKMISLGFDDWEAAAYACVKSKNLQTFKFAIDNFDFVNNSHMIIHAVIDEEFFSALRSIHKKFPSLREYIEERFPENLYHSDTE